MNIAIRIAESQDANVIAKMLEKLAIDIGDTEHYKGSQEAIRQFGFGSEKLFHCLIAESDKTAVGFAIYFPTFSTTRGEPGVYLQDLWVDKVARGRSVANKLLQHVSLFGSEHWRATHMTLAVYTDNTKAMQFYKTQGFKISERERHVALDGDTFLSLIEGR